MRFSASYTDGLTAQRHAVWVQPGRTALHLDRADGEALEPWPYAGLSLAEEVYGSGPVRLRHRLRGEATLTVAESAVLDHLAALGGPRLRGGFWTRPSLRVGLLAVVVLVGLVAGAYRLLPLALAPLARWVPPAWEQALGERVVESLAAGSPPCAESAGQAALERLSARLTVALEQALGAEGRLPYPLRVRVVDSDTVNAFAAPGGQVVLMRGLVEAAASPDEVAGVLAHEMAHVARRHPTQGLIRAAGTTLLFKALMGDHSALESSAAQLAQLLLLISYTRQDELAADRTAVAVLNAADIRGRGLSEFLARMAARQGQAAGALPALLSTHPLFDDRMALIQAGARGTGRALSAAEWKALQGICPEGEETADR